MSETGFGLKSVFYSSYLDYDNVDWFVNEVIKLKKKIVFFFKNFLPFVFHILENYDCHLFFEKLVGKKNDKFKFHFIPKTNEQFF